MNPEAPGDPEQPVPALQPADGDSEPIIVAGIAGAPHPSQHPGWKKPNAFVRAWRKLGGGSLTFSLLIHGGLLFIATLFVIVTQTADEQIDFLPGGGTQQGAEASAELAHQVTAKKRLKLQKAAPMKRIVSLNANASIVLPDAPPELLDVPDVSSALGGKMTSGGFGTGGSGGGFGSGHGSGGLRGIAFKPIMMFGRELKNAKKIAVVMDVSRSMTRYLPIVAKELDNVARHSPLVLYFGCGLSTPRKGDKLDETIYKANGPFFDRFWQLWQGRTPLQTPPEQRKLLMFDPGKPMPLQAIYNQMNTRPHTWFVEFNGIIYSHIALTCKEVMEADVIYWFSDFQDRCDEEMMKDVLKVLKKRKQRLVMHASIQGRNFEKVRDGVCLPSGGEVIETKVE